MKKPSSSRLPLRLGVIFLVVLLLAATAWGAKPKAKPKAAPAPAAAEAVPTAPVTAPAAEPVAAPAPDPAAAPTPPPEAPAAPAVAAPVPASPAEEGPVYARGGLYGLGLVVGAKLGAGFGQPFSELGTAFVPELELGYLLPPLQRSLQLSFTTSWAAPGSEGKAPADARLPGDGVMSYSLTEQQLIFGLGLLYRLPLSIEWLRPYAAAGARLYLLKTEVDGAAGGEAFGGNEETATEPGFVGLLGSDFFVGPGALNLELQLGYAGVDGYVMRNTSVGALNVLLGYRFFL
ncbi:MAG: hypothetical protein RBU45_04190 [Myxococcota bacterium]|jgi:hypothetical protein|nr:hypothetical protein [Myxococcota bacterium]